MKTMLTRIFVVLALCCVFAVDGCGRGKSKSETSTAAPTAPRFSVTYYKQLGYLVNTINGVTGVWDPDETFWAILSDGRMTSTGASSYMPYNGDHVTFKFTQGYKCVAEMIKTKTDENEK